MWTKVFKKEFAFRCRCVPPVKSLVGQALAQHCDKAIVHIPTHTFDVSWPADTWSRYGDLQNAYCIGWLKSLFAILEWLRSGALRWLGQVVLVWWVVNGIAKGIQSLGYLDHILGHSGLRFIDRRVVAWIRKAAPDVLRHNAAHSKDFLSSV